MKRRDLFRVGTGAVAVAAVESSPLGAQHNHPVTEATTARASAADWKPQVFDSHQNETVIVLTEHIIPETDTPGAKAALVNRYIDLFLHDGPAERRVAFLEGLAWMDGYAIRNGGAPFLALAADRQVAILERVDRGEDDTKGGQSFFRLLKSMTASIYYATAIGFRELNKGGRVPTGFGCNGKNSE